MCTLMVSANKSLEKKKFPPGWKCYKTIGSCVSCAFIEVWSTACASYLDEHMLMYELIVKWSDKEYHYFPLDGMSVHYMGTSQHSIRPHWLFIGTHLYLWMERGSVRAKTQCMPKNTTHWPTLKAWLLNLILLEVKNNQLCQNDKTLTTRPPF